jgi:23S rRNA pseudouridine1911/1915/1917 synthase
MPKRAKYEILYEDKAILVVNKPAGLLSIPDRYDPGIPNLWGELKKARTELLVVHRLDKDTSGLICFAQTKKAHRSLSQSFEGRKVRKVYSAIVEGQPQPPEGEIEVPLFLNAQGKVVVSKKGKKAHTSYRTLEKFRHFSFLEVSIQTGRTHQIRVHLQHLGHPLVIDPLYGKRDAFLLSEIKGKGYRISKDEERERPLINRTTLHAWKLGINHPSSGDFITFEAPLPKDLKALLNQLRKWNSLT